MSSACLFAAAIRIKSNSCKYYLVSSLSDDCPSMLWFPIVTHYHITIYPRRSHPSKLGAQDHTTNFLLDCNTWLTRLCLLATSLQINFFLLPSSHHIQTLFLSFYTEFLPRFRVFFRRSGKKKSSKIAFFFIAMKKNGFFFPIVKKKWIFLPY